MKNIIFTILSFSFLLSCNSIEESKIINKKSSQLTYSQLINLDNNFSYEEYKNLVIEYGKKGDYPDIK